MKSILEQSQEIQALIEKSKLELAACQILLASEALQEAAYSSSPVTFQTHFYKSNYDRNIEKMTVNPSASPWFDEEHIQSVLQSLNIDGSGDQVDSFLAALQSFETSSFVEKTETLTYNNIVCSNLTFQTSPAAIAWFESEMAERVGLESALLEEVKFKRLKVQLNEEIPGSTLSSTPSKPKL